MELVLIPFSEFGPLMPWKLMNSKYWRDALLFTTMLELSKPYVSPTRAKLRLNILLVENEKPCPF